MTKNSPSSSETVRRLAALSPARRRQGKCCCCCRCSCRRTTLRIELNRSIEPLCVWVRISPLHLSIWTWHTHTHTTKPTREGGQLARAGGTTRTRQGQRQTKGAARGRSKPRDETQPYRKASFSFTKPRPKSRRSKEKLRAWPVWGKFPTARALAHMGRGTHGSRPKTWRQKKQTNSKFSFFGVCIVVSFFFPLLFPPPQAWVSHSIYPSMCVRCWADAPSVLSRKGHPSSRKRYIG